MSGGAFDYNQRRILDIVESIEEELARQGTTVKDIDFYFDSDYSYTYPTYSEEVQKEIRKGIEYLKIAYVYAQRIEWLFSGDDGEETFLQRLKEDLEQYENQ